MTGESRILAVENPTPPPQMRTMNISVDVPHSSNKRRVHLDGFSMLDAKYNAEEHKQKMMALEARVRRLEYEEKRA